MEQTGTAVATVPQAPTDDEIAAFRAKGRALALQKKETQELFRTIEGMEWGAGSQVVKGSSFSPQTRYLIAQYAQVTKANLLTQVDVLGGKPYLNVNYWKDRVSQDPMYVDDYQRDISTSAEAALRALGGEEDADEIAMARLRYGPPEWATHVIETVIRRWMNAAPLAAIKAGKVPWDEAQNWIIEVRDFNFAGNRPITEGKKRDGGKYSYQSDPVGNAEPAKTAASRSFRRCAAKAFSAWMAPFEEQIRKAEEAIEAEWEVVQESKPEPTGSQAVSTGSGEPERASDNSARSLPVRGEPEDDEGPVSEIVEDEPEAEPEEPFDANDARKRFFATLHDVGVPDKERKAWAKENGFDESTKKWGKAEFDRAQELLVGPIRDEVTDGCEALGVDVADLCLQVLGADHADYAKEWVALRAAVRARVEAAVDDDADEDL